MKIAKGVLSALSGEYKAGGQSSDTEFAHTLFYCEEIMGAPTVVVRVIHVSKEVLTDFTSSPCHKSSTVKKEIELDGSTFLFVSPETIIKYAKTFVDIPEEFDSLVAELAEKIKE